MSEKRIIEVGGVKMEIDLRHAKTVDTYRVGDRVKVLIKEYTDSYKSYAGVIVGFDAFESLPTIVIAYLKVDYNSAEVKLVYINSETKDTEITCLSEGDIPFSKEQVDQTLDKLVEDKRKEFEDALYKRDNFHRWFGNLFSETK